MNPVAFEVESSKPPGLPLKENVYIRLTAPRSPLTHEKLTKKLTEASNRATKAIDMRALRAKLESHNVTAKRAGIALANFQKRQALARDISLRQLNAYLIRNTMLACRSNNISRHYAYMHDKRVFRSVHDAVVRRERGEQLQKRITEATSRRAQILKGRIVKRENKVIVKPIQNLLGAVIEVSSVSSFASISSIA